jgi:hypothetical protein
MCCSIENTAHVSSRLQIFINTYHCVLEELEFGHLILAGFELVVFSKNFCCNKSSNQLQYLASDQYIPAQDIPLEKEH